MRAAKIISLGCVLVMAIYLIYYKVRHIDMTDTRIMVNNWPVALMLLATFVVLIFAIRK